MLDNLSRASMPVATEVPLYVGEIGDREVVERIARDHRLDACLHFAALAYVGESVADPARYFENNVEQGVRMLSALQRPALVSSSSPPPAPPTASRSAPRSMKSIRSGRPTPTAGRSS